LISTDEDPINAPANAKFARELETNMVTTAPIARPGILSIEAYIPGESKVPGNVKPAKLSSNETPLGPSPRAIAAFTAAAAEL
jgi:histidinol-phosphate aminotransferase